ncbi:MAG: hypothetical protein E7340_06480 [Clostridiales bacterium]|nr:hypothetical protein [Clostridiales bacterium]
MKKFERTKNYDFDDYFMQRINRVEFNDCNLTLTVSDRVPLKFCGVNVEFAALNAFRDCADKTLYSLFVNEENGVNKVELKILCEEELCELYFTTKEIKA